MTTYRTPPSCPNQDVCLALYWLLDEHNHRIDQTHDLSHLVFFHLRTFKTHRVDPETIVACEEGGWVTYHDADDKETLTLTNRGRDMAQRFQKLNKI